MDDCWPCGSSDLCDRATLLIEPTLLIELVEIREFSTVVSTKLDRRQGYQR